MPRKTVHNPAISILLRQLDVLKAIRPESKEEAIEKANQIMAIKASIKKLRSK